VWHRRPRRCSDVGTWLFSASQRPGPPANPVLVCWGGRLGGEALAFRCRARRCRRLPGPPASPGSSARAVFACWGGSPVLACWGGITAIRRAPRGHPSPHLSTRIPKGLAAVIPAASQGFPIHQINGSTDLALPPPIPIPDWRGFQKGHPRPSQIGVDFSDQALIGVGFRRV